MTTAARLDEGVFRHVEAELFRYHDTKREIEKVRKDIIYRTSPPDENVGGGRGNLPGDPTGRTATILLSHRKLEQMERVVEAISTVYEMLPEEKKKLVKMRYWSPNQRYTWDRIALELHASKTTVLRWRDDIVEMIAQEVGWA